MNTRTSTVATLTAHALYQASLFQAGPREPRDYLRGVCLQSTPEGVVAVATDGHHLGAALSPHGPDARPVAFEDLLFTVDTDLRNALRKKTADRVIVEASDDRQSATVTVNYSIGGRVEPAAFKVALIDGRFPDWRHFLRGTARRLVQVDPQAHAGATVAPISTAATGLWQRLSVANGKRANVRLHASAIDGHRMDPHGVVRRGMVIRLIGDEHFFGLLMPVSFTGGASESRHPLPDWVNATDPSR